MSRDALIIGINRYRALPDLETPANDAEAIATILQKDGHFTTVRRLPEMLSDGEATLDYGDGGREKKCDRFGRIEVPLFLKVMSMSETQLDDTLNRIAEQVEAIGGFVGRSAELQLATQHKLDALSETVNRMTERMDSYDEKWEQRFNRMTERMDAQDEKWEQRLGGLNQTLDRMTERMDSYDEKWEQRLNLLTASSERQQASIDRMAASIESAAERQQITIDRMATSIENASIRQENVLAEYQKTAQALIQLATAMMQQKAG